MPFNNRKQKGCLDSQTVKVINIKLKTGQLGKAVTVRRLLIGNKNNI